MAATQEFAISLAIAYALVSSLKTGSKSIAAIPVFKASLKRRKLGCLELERRHGIALSLRDNSWKTPSFKMSAKK